MKRHIFFLTLFFAAIVFSMTDCTSAPEPCGPVPAARQLSWQQLECCAFVHFNMNTFTGVEWGYGDTDPSQFNPTALDCRQWARVFRDAGFKGVILTAKHHDGFCLWPTSTTEYSIKNSPYKQGRGDIVKELSDACREYGLKFGVYLSPWDRHQASYGKPEYIAVFREQLRELLSNYGEIFEVWFDGANGGDGYYGGARERREIDRSVYYDWEHTWKIVRELQPGACIFSDGGPDARWVGNESGFAGRTNWSLLNRENVYPGTGDPAVLNKGDENGTRWLPAESDVSIRPGWYYHASEDSLVKSPEQLLDIYYRTVGRNCALLLNVPADRRGRIQENDEAALRSFHDYIAADFRNNLAGEASVTASDERGSRFRARYATDGAPETCWATRDGVTTASLQLDFDAPVECNRLLLQEYIPLGQRVKAFTVEAFMDGQWTPVAMETTIGYKRILRFNRITTEKLRIRITGSKCCICLSNVEVYNAPDREKNVEHAGR